MIETLFYYFKTIKQVQRPYIILNTKKLILTIMELETKPWVLVSSLIKDVDPQKVQEIVPQITSLVDEWQSQGRIMWSGPFDNQLTSMTVFEATEEDAREFFKKYENICSGVLNYYLYQWDAMPLLSILSK